jgi:hypothetical protein
MNAIILVLIVISGTTVAVDSKNTSERQQKLAEYQEQQQQILELTHSRGEQCTESKGVENGATFSPYDYAVVIAMLAISLKIGVFYGFCHKGSSLESSSSDFMLGSQMSLIPVTISLTTSFVTAIELLGNPAEMFFFGSQFALIGKQFAKTISFLCDSKNVGISTFSYLDDFGHSNCTQSFLSNLS